MEEYGKRILLIVDIGLYLITLIKVGKTVYRVENMIIYRIKACI